MSATTKLSEGFAKGMDHLKTGQDKVVEILPFNLLKWSLFILNFYFLIYSFYSLGTCGQILIINLKHGRMPKDLSFYFNLFNGPLLLVAFVLANLAIFSKKPNFSKAFCILVIICLILQIGMDVSSRKEEGGVVRAYVQERILVEFGYLTKEQHENVQTVQQKYKCCGVKSYEDYRLDVDMIPSSCCEKYSGTDYQVGDCSENELKSKPGCWNAFNRFFRGDLENLHNPGHVGVVSVLYVVGCLVCSMAWFYRLHVINKASF